MKNATANIKPWQGANFYIALVLLVGGLFVGFPQGEATNAVQLIFALIASLGAIREKVKSIEIDWKSWLKSANTWNYLQAVLVSLIPSIPVDLFQSLRQILEAAIGGNWQGIIAGVFSLATILYYWLRPKS